MRAIPWPKAETGADLFCHKTTRSKIRLLLKDITPIFWAHDERTSERKSRFPLMRKML
jgi:hypothetical protein